MEQKAYNEVVVPKEILVELADIKSMEDDAFEIIALLFSADVHTSDIFREWLSTNTKTKMHALLDAMGFEG